MEQFRQNESGRYDLSAAESRRIVRGNRRLADRLERLRNRKNVPPEEFQTQMRDPGNVMEIENLKTCFYTDRGTVKAVDDVTFDIPRGGTVGVVGESGCGKSVLSLSIMQLLQRPQGQIADGAIRFDSGDFVCDIARMPEDAMRRMRGNRVSMIFQEPTTSLNPVLRIGEQVDEAIRFHQPELTDARIRQRTLEMLDLVQIAGGGDVCRMFPHALSGGMRQRAMIAMALACSPRLILADEPTSALDVTIQAQILDLLRNLKEQIGASILLISHDLGVIAEMADYVVVLYAGRVVEQGTANEVFLHPAHPYTIGLLKARPVAGRGQDRLYSIPGAVPSPIDMPDVCSFRDRCAYRFAACAGKYPDEIRLSGTHSARCYLCGNGGANA